MKVLKVKLNKKKIYQISGELSQLLDYVPYCLRTQWFEYQEWIDNIYEHYDAEEAYEIHKRVSRSTFLSEQERMQELIEWLKDYPQYEDVLVW